MRLVLTRLAPDAQWYTREQILEVLAHPIGATLTTRDHKKFTDMDKDKDSKEVESKQVDEPPFRIPPTTAIAGMLIRDWAERKIGFPPIEKGNSSNL